MADNQQSQQDQRKKYDNAPKIESFVARSKDGKYIIHRTVITDIRSALYYEKVLSNDGGNEEVDA